jgi:hypothetical protein
VKSLNDRYVESHANTHETFADLIFCALVVLVLFIMMLAVEVSQRVRAANVQLVEVEKAEDVTSLNAEEVEELSKRLQQQRAELEAQSREIAQLRQEAAAQAAVVGNRIAALNGEQRFTGATEPAQLLVAYDYRKNRFAFVRRKEFDHATTQLTGESALAFALRRTRELVDLALLTREQRFFTADEASKIYAAFTTYQQINPTRVGYTISTERIGVSYSVGLSAYIAGDQEPPAYAKEEVEQAVQDNFETTGRDSEAMYPSATVKVLPDVRRIVINDVVLTPREFKDVLLSTGGRGVMLDFEGYDGPAPKWLVEEVLTPTGYVGKTPKLPGS